MSNRPFIMALDAASTTGIAEGRAGETPRLYSKRFVERHDEHRNVFGRALGWIAERIDEVIPDVVYIEAPMSPGAPGVKTNPDTTLRLIGLWALFSGECNYRGIICREASVQTVRKGFIGSGRVDGGGQEAKRRVFAMCQLLGWNPTDKDSSDAGALWHYAVTRFAPDLAPPITPMMWAKVATRIGNVDVGSADALFRRPSA